MSYTLRFIGLGALYGFAFALVKALFPEPFILFVLKGGQSSEGNLAFVSIFYITAGFIAGLIAGPLFGGLLRLRRSRASDSYFEPKPTMRIILSLLLALLMGLISGLIILGAYYTGVLPPGKILDPFPSVRNVLFPIEPALVVIWAIARDLLPAGFTGLLLSPIGGGPLLRLYAAGRHLAQKHYEGF